jgi:hypothetical protein
MKLLTTAEILAECERLRQATQAGTPYSVEQDGINALHLRVSELEQENEQLRRINTPRESEPDNGK